MPYDKKKIGPALGRLREAANLSQTDIAKRMGLGATACSRMEIESYNPRAANLLRYLEAVGATLEDLHREMVPAPADALDQHAENVTALIDKDAGYRGMAHRMLERFGGAAPGEWVEFVFETDERLRRLEAERLADREKARPRGSDGEPVE